MPQAYELDLKDLKRNFLKFQQKVHPDLFSGQGEKESWAKSWSGKVNDAFKLLENGRSRGEYLVSGLKMLSGHALGSLLLFSLRGEREPAVLSQS